MSPSTHVAWFGVGHAGIYMLRTMLAGLPDRPDTVAIHVRDDTFEGLPATRHYHLRGVYEGLGSAGDVATVRAAARAARAELADLVRDYRAVFIIAGLGGGTGSGISPVLAEVARELGVFTVGIVTLPFFAEGTRKRQIANEARAALAQTCDVLIELSHQRIMERIPDGTPLAMAFDLVGSTVGRSLHLLWRLLSGHGILVLDLADLRRLVPQTGTPVSLAAVEAQGSDRVSSAVRELFSSPLLDHGAMLSKAPAVLLGMVGGEDLTLRELNELSMAVADQLPVESDLTLGAVIDPAFADRLGVVLLIAESTPPLATPPPAEVAPAQEPAAVASGPGERKPLQPEFEWMEEEKPRIFQATPTTSYQGVDLDIPTFLRRGIRLSRPYR